MPHIRDVLLSEEQKTWFSDRMDETPRGRVIIPTYLITKFRKITGMNEVDKILIHQYLIDNCYNRG